MSMIRIALVIGLIVGAVNAGVGAIDSFAGASAKHHAAIKEAGK